MDVAQFRYIIIEMILGMSNYIASRSLNSNGADFCIAFDEVVPLIPEIAFGRECPR